MRLTDDIFLASAVLYLLLICIIWFARRVRGQDAGAAAGAAH